MVSLQPMLLACPTATLRARAERLAMGLAGAAATPTPSTHSPPTSPHASEAGPRTLHPAAKRRALVPAVEAGLPGPEHGTHGLSGGPTGVALTPEAVQEAMELFARQPAFLAVPPARLCGCCQLLSQQLRCTPQAACRALARLRPGELDRLLQAPPGAVVRAWRGLSGALQTLAVVPEGQRPAGGGQGPGRGPAHGGLAAGDSALEAGQVDEAREQESPEGKEGGTLFTEGMGQHGATGRAGRAVSGRQPAASTSDAPRLYNGTDSAEDGTDAAPVATPYPAPRRPPPPPPPAYRVLQPEDVQRMVLLCPQLLMVPPAALLHAAGHLRALLGISRAAALRRLLVRSPRLLLLPRGHADASLRALCSSLSLRRDHAARLALQQPNLLKWEPRELDEKLYGMSSELEMSPGDVVRLVRNAPSLLAMSVDNLAAKLRALQELLATHGSEEVRHVVLRQPGVLSMSSAAVGLKLRQLQQGLGLKAAEEGLAVARRMALDEPTLLTCDLSRVAQRMASVAVVLGTEDLARVRGVVRACPRLLVVQPGALRHKVGELKFALRVAHRVVCALVLARPDVVFAGLGRVVEAVEGVERDGRALGQGQGREGRARQQRRAVVEWMAANPRKWHLPRD